MGINNHDVVFWFGDLNYRIDLPDEEVKEAIAEENWDLLLEADQLKQQMSLGNVFDDDWVEADIAFAPTYKYDPHTTIYDTSDKKRIPAWCDRILWKSDYVSPLHYRRFEMLESDHRPIAGEYEVDIKSILEDQRMNVYQEIVKEIDRLENDIKPDAELSRTECDFGEVRYRVPVRQTLTIENTGKVAARWSFIPKPGFEDFCKPWLWVSPNLGLLVPGEKVTISLKIHITEETASVLNLGEETLEDILILHFQNGKDYYIMVTGVYLKSSFACSLDYLVRFPHPIRQGKPIPQDSKNGKLRIPKELWRIIDWIYHNAMEEEDLFLETGNQVEMASLREGLDTGQRFPKKIVLDPHSMAETLLRFLESLITPVIPYQHYKYALDASSSYSNSKQVISQLPEVHYNTFYYVIAFLREVLEYTEQNNLTAAKLAFVFSTMLLRTPPDGKVSASSRKKRMQFILNFLNEEVLEI
eukprot:TRINITY_DN3776_c0_g1_i1.p1 TRINITY_DN3776_c0_g1~~TRINITY_DN3776_c0_g1_i1.p1  ORF type:complete len:514 (-),score=125.63 TRINITY_DN3776_c0_g1_i1:42-1454(-)